MPDRSVSVPMTLSDLERREARAQIVQADLLKRSYRLTQDDQMWGRA